MSNRKKATTTEAILDQLKFMNNRLVTIEGKFGELCSSSDLRYTTLYVQQILLITNFGVFT